jgi:spermidine synthase
LRPRLPFGRESWQSVAVTAALPAVLALLPLLSDWARAFAASSLALLAGATLVSFGDIVIDQERTFFGVHRVTRASDSSWHTLMHGNTTHGFQFRDPEHKGIPTSYYHPDGPAADAFYDLIDREQLRRVALVGLGTGSMAAYSRPGMLMRFYEIDDAVVRIATDPGLFSYAADSKARVETVLGDGRVGLARSTDVYDAIVLDAFSADAIPVHLITLEAFRDAYLPRLAERGFISIHISNRYFDLSGHLARVAAELGLVARICRDNQVDDQTRKAGKFASTWVVFARAEADLGKMLTSPAWAPLGPRAGDPLWTDQRSSLLGSIKGLDAGF